MGVCNNEVSIKAGAHKVEFDCTLIFLKNYFICYSKVPQLQLLSQSKHAQTDYTPKHTCNSTITTQGMPTIILQVLFKKEETNHFYKRRKLTGLQSPFVH